MVEMAHVEGVGHEPGGVADMRAVEQDGAVDVVLAHLDPQSGQSFGPHAGQIGDRWAVDDRRHGVSLSPLTLASTSDPSEGTIPVEVPNMPGDDPRPDVWVGHVVLPVPDIATTDAFMQGIGMRPVVRNESVAVLELRGGTHLVVVPGDGVDGDDAPFDLMVEDLDGTHAQHAADGLEPSTIERGNIHDSFTIRAPSGHTVTFNSTHVGDLPV